MSISYSCTLSTIHLRASDFQQQKDYTFINCIIYWIYRIKSLLFPQYSKEACVLASKISSYHGNPGMQYHNLNDHMKTALGAYYITFVNEIKQMKLIKANDKRP